MNIDAFNEMHRDGRIEPETNAAQTDEEVGLISIAVSLKRIADALDSESPKGSVLYWLEQIASAANAGRS